MLELSWSEVLSATCVMAFGSLVQASIGFGSAVIAAPLLALANPVFVPGPIIMAITVLTLLVVRREPGGVQLRPVAWALLGRLPGTGLGVWALRGLSKTHLAQLFALMVLLAVAMLTAGRAPPRTRSTMFLAGLTAGVMGTVSSIGGPPIALMFHDEKGPTLRATLGTYFLLSTVMSLGGLALAELLGTDEMLAFFALLPGTLLGFACAGRLRGFVDRGYTRPAILTLAALSALSVLVRSLG